MGTIFTGSVASWNTDWTFSNHVNISLFLLDVLSVNLYKKRIGAYHGLRYWTRLLIALVCSGSHWGRSDNMKLDLLSDILGAALAPPSFYVLSKRNMIAPCIYWKYCNSFNVFPNIYPQSYRYRPSYYPAERNNCRGIPSASDIGTL